MTRPAGSDPYVFISYASVNRDRVVEIVDVLDGQGIPSWFDRSDIPGGTSYGPEIVSGIKDSVAVVLMCSEASLASRNVRQEIQLAWRHERPILPLLMEHLVFPDDVSYWLEEAQWIEVLDHPPNVWLDQVRHALGLMGFGGLQPEQPAEHLAPAFDISLPPNNLSLSGEPIVGRSRELKQLRLLLEHSPLVTLTGPGGTGKTRLAEAAAVDSALRFADGIWFIDVSATNTAAGFFEAVAATLDVQESPGTSIAASIVSKLSDRKQLLIVDNLEQIPDAGTLVDQLLAAPGLTILATSRTPLRSADEIVVPVAPLEVLHPAEGTPASVIASNPSVQLFVNRAKQAKPDFQLSDGNAVEVAQICAKLDGLPLAIELAAARTRLLHPAALLARLDNRLNVLTRGTGRSARQSTLHATLSWSYDLLSPADQAVFQGLGAFEGTVSTESLEAVLPSVFEGLDEIEVLDAIDNLIDHSLLEIDRTQRDAESTRLRMLETIREFATSVLHDSELAEAAYQAHAHHFLEQASRIEPELEAGMQALALDEIAADQANYYAAIDRMTYSSDQDLRATGLQIAARLWRYWWMRGAFSEGWRLLKQSLDANAEDSAARVLALNGAGVLLFSIGDLAQAQPLHTEAATIAANLGLSGEVARSRDNLGIIAITEGRIDEAVAAFSSALEHYRECDDIRGTAVALEHLAATRNTQGDLQQAASLAKESLALWRRLGDQQSIGHALQHLGIIEMYNGEFESARDHFQEALSFAESIGDRTSHANALLNLGSATEMLGHTDAATHMLEEARSRYRDLDDAYGSAYTQYMLGHVARSFGDPIKAVKHLRLAASALQQVGALDAVALCLETLAGCQSDLEHFDAAATLLGSANAIRDQIGVPVPGTRTAELERDFLVISTSLGPDQFEFRLQEGAQRSPNEALKAVQPEQA